ncbi:MAG: hypothetical protein HQM09_02130 [Candidatus Riflebacteria bacterium]|nr:hypothetical protein [Candidatus Riflebacteria bacterium]
MEQSSAVRILPRIVYGKCPMRDEYDILSCHPDIPADVRNEFRNIRSGFEWVSAATGIRFPSAFAVRSIPGFGILIIRFSDQGPDRHGRPHSLRIDGLFDNSTTDIMTARSYLHESSWTDEIPEGKLRPASEAEIQAGERAATGLTPGCIDVLVGETGTFQNRLFSNVLALHCSKNDYVVSEAKQEVIQPSSPIFSQFRVPLKSSFSRVSLFPAVIILVLSALMIATVSSKYYGALNEYRANIEREQRTTIQEREKSARLEKEIATLQETVQSQEAKLKAVKKQLGE